MTTPFIAEVRNLHKAFGAQTVLQGVSLGFAKDRCTFIAGPSGTGKSVLVRHLVGLLKPDSGEVYYDSNRVDILNESDLLKLRRRCVYVFQHPTLFDSMSILENVSLVLRYHFRMPKSQADAQAEVELKALGLSNRLLELPSHLPQGEQKLVSVARALALKPETLILDEPTTGLDPFAAQQLDDVVGSVVGSGRTLLVISHDLQSIRRLAHQVAFLHKGLLRFHGPTSHFFANHDPILQGFVAGDPETPI